MPEGLAEGTMRKLRNAAEAKTFRLPERRDETGLRRAVRVAFRRAGIGDQGAANAVPEEPKDCRRKGILCGYMLATSGANIVCVPEAGLKSLKIRR